MIASMRKLRLTSAGLVMIILMAVAPMASAKGGGGLPVPSAPTGLSVSRLTQPTCVTAPCNALIGFTWNASPASEAVTSYQVFMDSILKNTITATSTPAYSASVTAGSTHTFFVRAVNNAGVGPSSSTLTIVAPGTSTPPPTSAPTAPTNLRTLERSPQIVCPILGPCFGSFTLAWDAAPASQQVTSYQVFRNGALLTTVSGSSTSFATSATQGTTNVYTVRAVNAIGTSPSSNSLTITP